MITMTAQYGNGERRHRRRAVIPIITFLLCLSAMIAVGYSALISDVTNEANLIAADGLDVKFLNGDGEILEGGEFARGANGGTGASRIRYGFERVDDHAPTFLVCSQSLELGQAILDIRPLESSDVRYVTVWYELSWTAADPESLYGMTTSLSISNGDNAMSVAEGERTEPFDIFGEHSYLMTLSGTIPDDVSDVVDEPGVCYYSITIHMEPCLY